MRLVRLFATVLALTSTPVLANPAQTPVVKNSANQPIEATPVICVDAAGTYTGCGGGGSGGTSGGTATAASPTYTEGATGQPLSVDLSGNLRTRAAGIVVTGDQSYSAGQFQLFNLTPSGRVKVGLSSANNITPGAKQSTTLESLLTGCQYLATPPTWSDTWTGATTCNSNGALRVDGSGATQPISSAALGSTSDAASDGSTGSSALAYLRSISVQANSSTPSAVNLSQVGSSAFVQGARTSAASISVVQASDSNPPTSTLQSAGNTSAATTATNTTTIAGFGGSVLPSANTAVGSSRVLKSSAGSLLGLNVVAGGTAGYILIFDATSAPADGAVTPLRCLPIATNTGVEFNWRTAPLSFATGITVVFSSTGCFTKTASATAFISGDVR